jgi:HSP20 family molecular chaperone IbpA
MFEKKKCSKCKSNVKKDFDFCPYCGNRINFDSEDWGMLGKNDFVTDQNPLEGLFSGGMLGKMLGNTLKMLEREMQKEMKKTPEENLTRTNFELYINGKRVNPQNIKVTRQPKTEYPERELKNDIKTNEFSEEKLKKLSKLPRQEPTTNIKRLSDRVIYEINIPGVKSIKDISIIQLENSIEIKAIGKDRAYFKLIPLNYPIINEKFSRGKLVLELETRN